MSKLVLDKREWFLVNVYEGTNAAKQIIINFKPIFDIIMLFVDDFKLNKYFPYSKKDIINFLRSINNPNTLFDIYGTSLAISLPFIPNEDFKTDMECEIYINIVFLTHRFDLINTIRIRFRMDTHFFTIAHFFGDRNSIVNIDMT